jgi:predicted AAA+ superfamily ATPase
VPRQDGAIFETAVVIELTKAALHRGESPRLYFWRTSAGMEVDLLVERGGEVVPIEIKVNATPRPAHAASIRRLRADLGAAAAAGYVVHPGDSTLPLGEGARALPFWTL